MVCLASPFMLAAAAPAARALYLPGCVKQSEGGPLPIDICTRSLRKRQRLRYMPPSSASFSSATRLPMNAASCSMLLS